MTDATMLEAANRLADVLERENAALAALDLAGAAAMLADKEDAVASFAHAWKCASPPAGDVERCALGTLAARLDAATRDNRSLLERGIEVQRRVLQVIARAVPRALLTQDAACYGAGGVAASPGQPPLTLSVRA